MEIKDLATRLNEVANEKGNTQTEKLLHLQDELTPHGLMVVYTAQWGGCFTVISDRPLPYDVSQADRNATLAASVWGEE